MGFRTLGAVILVGAGLAASPLAAQRATTTVSGVVVDEARGDALPNAVVLLGFSGRGDKDMAALERFADVQPWEAAR